MAGSGRSHHERKCHDEKRHVGARDEFHVFKRPISKACKKILCFVFLSVYPAEEQKPTAINVLQIYHIPERTDGTVFTRSCFVTFLGNREEEQKNRRRTKTVLVMH